MSATDVACLMRETRTAPQHVGGLAVFAPPPEGLDYERLVHLLEERISLAPRYRHKVRTLPGHLASPVWVDDPFFDITYHVRRSALPRPGGDQQLLDFCARIQSRLLDRSRPLWEIYLVEGLEGGRIAIVTKTHSALFGDPAGIDLAQVVLDTTPTALRAVQPIWMPAPGPSSLELLRDAVGGVVRRPTALTHAARANMRDVWSATARISSVAGGTVNALGTFARRAPSSPLQAELGEQRRLAVARTTLDDYRFVRDKFGVTVNDVVLAVVAGALRGWLMSRAIPLGSATTVRALFPVSIHDATDTDLPPAWREPVRSDGVARLRAAWTTARSATIASDPAVDGAQIDLAPGAGPVGGAGDRADAAGQAPATAGTDTIRHPGRVRPVLVDLPVGEPDAVLRLTQLRYAMAAHTASGRAVTADRLAALAGFAPPTIHALGVRAASETARRLFQVVITNVPGPQVGLFAAGARMIETFPILPLAPGQAMSIGLTSYDGGVYFGINGDWDATREIGLMTDLIRESLAELVDVAHAVRSVSTRGRGRANVRAGAPSRMSGAPASMSRDVARRLPGRSTSDARSRDRRSPNSP